MTLSQLRFRAASKSDDLEGARVSIISAHNAQCSHTTSSFNAVYNTVYIDEELIIAAALILTNLAIAIFSTEQLY